MLGKSCAPDIVANCRGVNIDTTRLKDCLYRNQDVMSAQCKADYPRALDAIQKRIAARATVGRECEYEVVKKCGGKGREVSKSLACLLALPNASARCTKSIADVGYRATDDVATKLSKPGNAAGAECSRPCARKSLERSKSRGKNEPPPQKRPPIAPELNKLPAVNLDIQFDADTPIVKPESYQKLGQLADTLVNSDAAGLPVPDRRPYRIDRPARQQRPAQPAKGRRDPRHPDQHLQDLVEAAAIGGTGRGTTAATPPVPTRPLNNQTQIMTLAKMPEQASSPPQRQQKARLRRRKSRRKSDKNTLTRRLRNRPRVPISAVPARLR